MAGDELDPVLHQPARSRIMTFLYLNRQAPLSLLRREVGLTPGNLSTHLSRLTEAGYVESRRVLERSFEVRIFITGRGAVAFERYVSQLRALLDRVSEGKA